MTEAPVRDVRVRWICTAIIALHAILLGWCAVVNSVVLDEFAHLPSGLAAIKYGDFAILNLHPPLMRMWAAIPLLATGADAPATQQFDLEAPKNRYWSYGEAFMRANSARYHRLFVLGRLMVIPVSCFGAWVVFRWAREIYGDRAGCVACLFYALCPNLLAHGSIVGTDVAVTVALLASAWLWTTFCRTLRWKHLMFASLAIACAPVCKFSGVLIWPVIVIFSAITIYQRPKDWRRVVGGLFIAGGVTLLFVNAVFRFQGTGTAAGNYQLQSEQMRRVFAALPTKLPIPFPREFMLGYDALKWEVEQQFPAYLLGESYRGSRWYYFPLALALKLPTGTILALLAAVVSIWKIRFRTAEKFPLIALATFLIFMIALANVNLGMRYVLPTLPFIFIFASRLWSAGWASRNYLRGALLVLLIIENAIAFPYYLSFFNLPAGGPSRGQFLMSDSNADWGQGLIALKKWMTANKLEKVQLGYFGRVDPAIYGIEYDLITERSSAPFVAVSSYYLNGLLYRLPTHSGSSGFVQLNFAEELRQRKPVAVVGGTIHIYDRATVIDALREAAARR